MQCGVVPNCKNPPKIRLYEFVKLSGSTYACNTLTNFDAMQWPETEITPICLTLTRKNSWNHIKTQVILILAGFAIWNHRAVWCQVHVHCGVQCWRPFYSSPQKLEESNPVPLLCPCYNRSPKPLTLAQLLKLSGLKSLHNTRSKWYPNLPDLLCTY